MSNEQAKNPLALTLLTTAVAATAAVLLTSVAEPRELPRIEQRGGVSQLIVDGQPYIALGGELHNSSPSSPKYMRPVWDRLARNGVRTVIGVATWELVEPQEGQFDFKTVDEQIREARAHGIKLALIWFGAFKNAESTYAPSWVRRDEARFPRAERDPATKLSGFANFLRNGVALSVFNDRLVEADARAFAALMRHVRNIDKNGTVVLVQVENETGLLADSRDRSAAASRAWSQSVPTELMGYLQRHRGALHPHLRAVWERHGFRLSGTWAEVFGDNRKADEIFMAWGVSRYVDRVARAGAAAYPLPMYSNAWLGPKPGQPEPGDYPSGGPVARMLDVWKAGAPSLAFLSPDIYVDDFAGTVAEFHRTDNPIFVPEAKAEVGNLFIALGNFAAIGFSPFGIEDLTEDHDMFRAYKQLTPLLGEIARAQQECRIKGFRTVTGSEEKLTLGGYEITVGGARSTVGMFGAGTGANVSDKVTGYGLIIQTGADQFLVVARATSLQFSVPGTQVEIDRAQETRLEKSGVWRAGRTLNGDERAKLFPVDALNVVRIDLLRRSSANPRSRGATAALGGCGSKG